MDVIHPLNGPEVRSYGGIYYAAATLATLLDDGDKVVPVFGVHKSDHPALIENLRQFPNIDTSGIFKFDAPTNEVHLFYHDGGTRIECSKHIAAPIPYDKIRRHLSVDGILVNMISGADLTVDTLDHIRMAVRSHGIPIHFDFHSLTLGVKDNFERYRRPVADWRRWAFMTDFVQLNEEELLGLDGQKLTEQQMVGHLMTLSVKGVIVTRGGRGATLYTFDRKKIVRKDIPGEPVDSPKDFTGCGDVFGAAFLLHYVKSGRMEKAAETANAIAARKARFAGTGDMKSLRGNTVTA